MGWGGGLEWGGDDRQANDSHGRNRGPITTGFIYIYIIYIYIQWELWRDWPSLVCVRFRALVKEMSCDFQLQNSLNFSLSCIYIYLYLSSCHGRVRAPVYMSTLLWCTYCTPLHCSASYVSMTSMTCFMQSHVCFSLPTSCHNAPLENDVYRSRWNYILKTICNNWNIYINMIYSGSHSS